MSEQEIENDIHVSLINTDNFYKKNFPTATNGRIRVNKMARKTILKVFYLI